MGVLLDSSVVISAQRAKLTPAMLQANVMQLVGDQDIVLSDVGYTELVHGHHRCKTELQRQRSKVFLDSLIQRLPIMPYSQQTAELVGRIYAEQNQTGNAVPLIDLMIGATALANGFSLLTTNLRHFHKIPDLDVIPF